MNCSMCMASINPGEERDHHGDVLCEDCYMDRLSPSKSCDPWAVHSAKSFMSHQPDGVQVNPTQARILLFLKETGGVEPKEVLKHIGISMKDLEREVASLRHMEKVKATMRDGKKILTLW